MDLAKSLKMTPLNINMQMEDRRNEKDVCTSMKDVVDQFGDVEDKTEDTNHDNNVFFDHQNIFQDKDCEENKDENYQSQIIADEEDCPSEKGICSCNQDNDISCHQNIYEKTESFENDTDLVEDYQSQIIATFYTITGSSKNTK